MFGNESRQGHHGRIYTNNTQRGVKRFSRVGRIAESHEPISHIHSFALNAIRSVALGQDVTFVS